MMHWKRRLGLLVVCILAVVPAWAQFTPIAQPDAGYAGGTTLLPVTVPDFDVLSSLGDGTLTVGFSIDLTALTTPGSWASWGAPPDTESQEQRLLWTNGLSDLTFTFSNPVDLFGFEAQPNTGGLASLVATFFNGATEVGQIPIDVDGNGGARLFAAQTTGQFTHVTFSGEGDFAVAQLRYGNVIGGLNAPEPGALPLLLLIGIPAAGAYLRRRMGVEC